MFTKRKILIIDDDKDVQFSLRTFLLENNFVIEHAYTGADGLKKARLSVPDLIILDLGLPDIAGESLCAGIKKECPNIKIIILTAKNTSQDAVMGLNLGADDYIPKPFDLAELLARINARLHTNPADRILKIADLSLNPKTYEVQRGGKNIVLTPTEYKLLEYLMQNRKQVLNRDMILDRVWSYDRNVETRVVDVYVGYLRKKIDKESKIKLIHNIRGFGYTLKQE